MSKWEKLLREIRSLSRELRFDELRRVLESYGYMMCAPRGGSSHYTFRKPGCRPITVPKHEPIQRVYVEMVRQVIEAALEDGLPVREPDDLENYSGQFKLRIPKSLHRSLAEHARQEGISMNQYCVYLLSRNDAAAR